VNTLRTSRGILTAVQSILEGLEVGGAPAFAAVRLFDIQDLSDAMRQLVVSEDRMAILIYAGDSFAPQLDVGSLLLQRTMEVTLIITDRRLDDRVVALVGDDETPGVLGLLDAVLPAITGVVVDETSAGAEDQVRCVPTRADSMLVALEDKSKYPGRQAISIDLQLQGQWIRMEIGGGLSL
jgi:hypothetical protein